MTNIAIWIISFLTIAGVIIRPFKITEAIWAIGGVILLFIFGLIRPSVALSGVARGTDVYLFLTGMMLLAETAREEKFFDWLAAHATKAARGSANRLFWLIYVVGVVVTVFLSNDATAVVLTPAVAAAATAAKVKKPLPYLLICAFIANAASFVLPISNPANLVIYGSHMPALLQWLSQYLLPSAVAILVTYILLRFTQRNELKQTIETGITIPVLSQGGKTAFLGIIATALVLLLASAFNIALGLPTAITGILTSLVVIIRANKNPLTMLKGVSWSVLPLVAGLFVIVEALDTTGLTRQLSVLLQQGIVNAPGRMAWATGLITGFACNLMNNLPAGLIVGNMMQDSNIPQTIRSAALIGIDLGPNLSVTGSLATILWLVALRREGIHMGAWDFLKLGSLIMTVTLLLTLAILLI